MSENNSVESQIDFINKISEVIPTGTQRMLAQFNATSGAYVNVIGLIPLEVLNTEHYKYVEVDIDPVTQKIVGNLYDFKVVDIALAPTRIFETQVNASCKEKIYKRFQPEVQLDILRVVIQKLCASSQISDEAFDDMNEYIDEVKRANKVLKAAYKANPDFEFVTIEQEQFENEEQLDGGLHELMGPRNLISIGNYTTK